MANDIVSGLFGLSPNQVQQQRQAQIDAQAAAYAQQAPFERAAAGMYRGGAGLGQLGAGMMGMVNPEVEAAKQREAALSQVDFNTPEGILAAAKAAGERGDTKMSLQLQILARQRMTEQQELELKQAQVKQALAHAKFYEQGGAAGGQSQLSAKQAIAYNNALKYYLDLNYPPEQARQLAEQEAAKIATFFDKQSVAAPQTTQVQSVSPANLVPGLSQEPAQGATLQGSMTPQDLQTIRQDALRNGDAATVQQVDSLLQTGQQLGQQVNPNLPSGVPSMTKAQAAGAIAEAKSRGERIPEVLSAAAGATEGGKVGVEIYTKQYHTADAASKVVDKADALINQLKTGDITTGVGADLRIGISRMQALLGGKDAAKNATDSQIADVMMGSDVFPLIQSLGVGARGMDTPAEREFMRKVLTGELSLEKGTLIKMAEMRKEAAQKDIDKWNKNVDEGNLDTYFKNVGIPKTKFGQSVNQNKEMSALPPPSQLTGKIVRDTVTGNRYKSDGTKWVKQ